MTLPSLATTPIRMTSQDTVRWAIVGVLVASALFTIMLMRQLTGPLDGLLTQQVCATHGNELDRPVIGYERQVRFALLGRSDGHCVYGAPEVEEDVGALEPEEAAALAAAAPDEVEELVIPLDEAEPGGLYRASKILAVLLQLGAASAVVRFLADPLLDRFVRRPG